jgi:hypothetical protein
MHVGVQQLQTMLQKVVVLELQLMLDIVTVRIYLMEVYVGVTQCVLLDIVEEIMVVLPKVFVEN